MALNNSESIDSKPPGRRQSSGMIWVDVTTIMRWDRPIVGVVRVEEQLTRWILDQGNDSVQFCRYDKGLGMFLDVDRETIAAQIRFFEQFEGRIATKPSTDVPSVAKTDSVIVAPESGKPARKPRTAWAKMRRKAKKLLRRALGKPSSPDSIQSDEKRPLEVSHQEIVQSQRSAFVSGDVYVSVGSDWDDKNPRRLYELKQELDLKVIGICYDTIPIKFPHLTMDGTARTFARYLADMAWVSDHVMCISRCTQRDFLEFADSVGAPLPETSIIRLGNDLLKKRKGVVHDFRNDAVRTGVVDEIAQRPFILFVSTIERRKNHELLYKVWVRLIEAGCSVPNLIFVGMHGWGVEDLLADLHRDPRVRGRIHILHGISDAELQFLYERCDYTVYPSLYEGWGLPVVESFAFGKFCLCSNVGSLTEAGENLAEYLDPWDVIGWTDRIRFFTEHPEEVEIRNKRVAASFRSHQWHQTSSSILRRAEGLQRPNLDSQSNEPARSS